MCTEPAPLSFVVEGTIKDGGSPATNASVKIVAWPNAATLSAISEGDEVPLLSLYEQTVGNSGSFFYYVHADQIPATYLNDQGAVDLRVTASDGNVLVPFSLTAAAAETWGPEFDTAFEPNDVTIDIGNGQATDEVNPPTEWRDAGDNGVTVAQAESNSTSAVLELNNNAARGARAAAVSCFELKGAYLPARQERFLSIYNWTGAKADVKQSVSTEHTLGIAVKGASGSASWRVGGSKTVSAGDAQTITGQVNKTYSNKVNYRYFTMYCGGYKVGTEARPVSTHSLFTRYEAIEPKNWTKGCTMLPVGSQYEKTKGSAYTKMGGVDLGFIDVNAQSGFSKSQVITFKVTQKSKICGDSSLGPVQSRGVQVHPF